MAATVKGEVGNEPVIINCNATALVSPPTRNWLIVGADAANNIDGLESFGGFNALIPRRANGTNASKSALLANDPIFILSAGGYGATGYSSSGRVSVTLAARENWTDTAQGTVGILAATPNGSVITSSVLTWTSDGVDVIGRLYASTYVRTEPLTVATLPVAATVGAGARAFVSDANATTFASIVAGGGANNIPVYCDGTNWRIG